MKRNGERTDEDGIGALAAHLLRQQLAMRFTKTLGGGEFEIPVGTKLFRGFMGDDLDTGGLGFFQHWLQHLCIIGHDADEIDLLGYQVLDGADLQGGIGARRADHETVNAELLALLLDPGLHGIEPRNAADLDDDAHLRPFGKGCGREQRERQTNRCSNNFLHDVPPQKTGKRNPPQPFFIWRAQNFSSRLFETLPCHSHSNHLAQSILPTCTIDGAITIS